MEHGYTYFSASAVLAQHITRLARRMANGLAAAIEHSCERLSIGELDEHALRDLGVCRSEIRSFREEARRFERTRRRVVHD